jgi:hypothetical protein
VNDSSPEIDQLVRDLQGVERTLHKALRDKAETWGLSVGPIRIQGTFSDESITIIFVVLNAACFALGVAFSLHGGTLNSLGVSLIVGSIFGIGAFVGQLWAVSYQRQREVYGKVFGEDFESLKALAAKRAEILEQIRTIYSQLDQVPDDLDNSQGDDKAI